LDQTDIIDNVESWTGPFLEYYRISSGSTRDDQALGL
jgi:hypothetical protein